MDFTPGIYAGLTYNEYAAIPAASKSGLDRIAQSPAHYRAWLEAPREETPALRFGRLFHRAVLEPERFMQTVRTFSGDRRTKAGKEEYAALMSSGADIVTEEERKTFLDMAASVQAHPLAAGLIYPADAGQNELTLCWYDQATGAQCKGRMDRVSVVNGLTLGLDLKTARDASQAGFARAVAEHRYHVQAAFYADGYRHATGAALDGFVFVAVEKELPYAVGVYVLDREAQELGRYLYQRDLMRLAECRTAGAWPGYSPQIETISLPKWATKEL